jgi:hypothetical protein
MRVGRTQEMDDPQERPRPPEVLPDLLQVPEAFLFDELGPAVALTLEDPRGPGQIVQPSLGEPGLELMERALLPDVSGLVDDAQPRREVRTATRRPPS